jgi:hypothetical protein
MRSSTMLELPSRSVRDYPAQFGLVHAWRRPIWNARARFAAAWWARDRSTADQVIMALGEARPATMGQAIREIQAAAARVGTTLSSHDTVLQRAKAVVLELDKRLSAAQQAGTLQFPNREYKRRRLAAERSGKKFIPYPEAQRRLKVALAGAAAGRGMPEIMRAVFDSGK